MLSQKLKSLRILNNLTQENLALKLSISRVRYNNYETGKRSPDLDTLHQIATYFGVTIDYLLHKSESVCKSNATEEIFVKKELEDLLHQIQTICTELMIKSEIADSSIRFTLLNTLISVLKMVDRML